MTREKALDRATKRADKAANDYLKGKITYQDVLAVWRMNNNVIRTCNSKGRSKKKLKK